MYSYGVKKVRVGRKGKKKVKWIVCGIYISENIFIKYIYLYFFIFCLIEIIEYELFELMFIVIVSIWFLG